MADLTADVLPWQAGGLCCFVLSGVVLSAPGGSVRSQLTLREVSTAGLLGEKKREKRRREVKPGEACSRLHNAAARQQQHLLQITHCCAIVRELWVSVESLLLFHFADIYCRTIILLQITFYVV